MKPFFASLLAAVAACGSPLLADTTRAASDSCPLTGTRVEISADCAVLRADYAERLAACMTERHKAAAARTGQSGTGSAHASRASYFACASEVRLELGVLPD